MATSAYEIVTLVNMKEYLSIRETDAGADEFLQRLIDLNSRRIEDYTRRKFKVQTVSNETHDHDGGALLYTRFFPITQLSTEASPSDAQKLAALQHRANLDSAWENVETDVDHIIITAENPFVALYDTVFYAGTQTVKVTYKAGFATVPEEVQLVCHEMVTQSWDKSKRGGGTLGLASQTRSEGGVTFGTNFRDLRAEHLAVLDFYRVRGIY